MLFDFLFYMCTLRPCAWRGRAIGCFSFEEMKFSRFFSLSIAKKDERTHESPRAHLIPHSQNKGRKEGRKIRASERTNERMSE